MVHFSDSCGLTPEGESSAKVGKSMYGDHPCSICGRTTDAADPLSPTCTCWSRKNFGGSAGGGSSIAPSWASGFTAIGGKSEVPGKISGGGNGHPGSSGGDGRVNIAQGTKDDTNKGNRPTTNSSGLDRLLKAAEQHFNY